MPPANIIHALTLAVVVSSSAGCAAAQTSLAPPRKAVMELSRPLPAPPALSTKRGLSTHDALARTLVFEEEGDDASLDEPAELQTFVRKHELDEATVRSLLEAVGRPCLAHAPPKQEPCERLGKSGRHESRAAELLLELAGELADPTELAGDTMRLLVQLDARGVWRAGATIERLLERRLQANLGACSPPSDAEVAAARASLSGFTIREVGRPPRAPNAAELSDLSYLHAALSASGDSVGTQQVDAAAKSLADGHADLQRRESLREEMKHALWDGDVARHAQLAEAYLISLGYPGPIRANEDGRMGWHGRPYSFVMREWARSAEILHDYVRSETLYRQAIPGGGPSGTGNAHKRDTQMEGLIRSAEQTSGCRRVLSERLFAVSGDTDHVYGPERLALAGFDVGRIYSGALLTMGQNDAWASRIRAIPGLAAIRGREAVPRLLTVAARASTADRLEALRAIERLVNNFGIDPCAPSGGFAMGGRSGGGRDVPSIMMSCDTALDAKAMGALVNKLAMLAGDASPEVRQAVAEALGSTASPRAKPALDRLAKDNYDAGGQRCITVDDQPEVCGPNLPVKHAAEDGLVALREAEETRAEQGAAPAP